MELDGRIDGVPEWWSVVGANNFKLINKSNAELVSLETVQCLSMFPCLVQEGMMLLSLFLSE